MERNLLKIFKVYNEFLSSLKTKGDLAVAVSGGPDSLALAYLTKCYSLKNKVKVKYYIVNHKLRKEASLEVEKVKKVLKKIDIQCTVLNWIGKKRSLGAVTRRGRWAP